MTLKKYHIFLFIATLTYVGLIGIPQLRGTAFINNYTEFKPANWLSSLLIKNYKKNNTFEHSIPSNIKTIKLVGNNLNGSNYKIEIVDDTNGKKISYDSKSSIDFPTNGDTLIINIKFGYVNSIVLALDSSITDIVIDGVSKPEIHVNQKSELAFTVQNKSEVTISGNNNNRIHHINVVEESTLNLINHFTPIIDLRIDNSIVYIDYLNHIDSLKTNLVGKSNIMKKELIVWRNDANSRFNEQKKELQIDKTIINIFPTGNLTYYNKQK